MVLWMKIRLPILFEHFLLFKIVTVHWHQAFDFIPCQYKDWTEWLKRSIYLWFKYLRKISSLYLSGQIWKSNSWIVLLLYNILVLNLICRRNAFLTLKVLNTIHHHSSCCTLNKCSSDRCCRVCNVSLTESISHLEPGVFVFDCGKWLSYFFIITYCTQKDFLLII